jgi:NAD(P)-dependent dehydrogenase (short-subunit alcohol dehydrogenase family)
MWNEFFTGKTVIVSGGSMGIGGGAVRAFAVAGARVVLADLADDVGTTLAKSLSGEGYDVAFRHCDVSSERDVESVYSWVDQHYGSLDVVFANAGVGWTKDVRHTTYEEWCRVVDINLTGMFLICRGAMRTMCDRKMGVIVVTSSPHALATVSDAGAYAASKGGTHSFIRSLALEGAPYGVRVNGVVPGTIDTPGVHKQTLIAKDPSEQLRLMAATHPLGRLGTPGEVANAVMFLASPLAEFVTGSTVSVDGGLMAGLPSGPPLNYNN